MKIINRQTVIASLLGTTILISILIAKIIVTGPIAGPLFDVGTITSQGLSDIAKTNSLLWSATTLIALLGIGIIYSILHVREYKNNKVVVSSITTSLISILLSGIFTVITLAIWDAFNYKTEINGLSQELIDQTKNYVIVGSVINSVFGICAGSLLGTITTMLGAVITAAIALRARK